MENDPYLTRRGRFWGYAGIMIIIAAVLVFAIIIWENFQYKTRLSDSIKKMVQNLSLAKRILRTNASAKNIVAVNGCCYGQENVEDKGDYVKKCGQSFWSFISGDDGLYISIIEPLGHRAKEQNEAFQAEYSKVVNRFTGEFIKEFCQSDGAIIWERLVRFNSGQETK